MYLGTTVFSQKKGNFSSSTHVHNCQCKGGNSRILTLVNNLVVLDDLEI